MRAEIREGDVAPPQGWVSFNYGRRQPAPVVIYSAAAVLPLRLVTLLYPTADGLASPPAVSPLAGRGPGPAGLAFEREQVGIRFDDEEVVISRTRA